MATKKQAKPSQVTLDYRSNQPVPEWVRDAIETSFAIKDETAQDAKSIGFMARALVLATMPYKDQKNSDGTPKESFTRKNGDFTLKILSGYGIPYGIYPRLLMGWITTEAVRNQSPRVELGESLREFLLDVLDLRVGAGKRGNASRVLEQMKRLFGSMITAHYGNAKENRGFSLRNVLMVDKFDVDDEASMSLWTPQNRNEVGAWKSEVRLTDNFYQEIVTNPVPYDWRAFKALRGSPMAMDIYNWLTYRMSYLKQSGAPIPWGSLLMQFGSGYGTSAMNESASRQAERDFKRGFLKAIELVKIVYPEVNLTTVDNGLVLLPSPPHVSPRSVQKNLSLDFGKPEGKNKR